MSKLMFVGSKDMKGYLHI